MKTLLLKVLEAIIVLVSVFVLGILPSTLVSSFITLFTNATFIECVVTGPFWIVTVLGWITSSCYLNYIYENN